MKRGGRDMKRKFNKGDVIIIFENGERTNQSTNLDRDRELSVGEVFEWRVLDKMESTKMKVLSLQFPLMVELVE